MVISVHEPFTLNNPGLTPTTIPLLAILVPTILVVSNYCEVPRNGGMLIDAEFQLIDIFFTIHVAPNGYYNL